MKNLQDVGNRLADKEKRLEAEGWFFEAGSVSKNVHVLHFWHFRELGDQWHSHLHGPDGDPAVVDIYRATGVRIREEWRFGKLNRVNGPARVLRDRLTGIVIQDDWFIWGHHHRIGGPAVIKYDRVTGATTYEAFWENGKKISERAYPENDTHPTPRMVAARNRPKRPKAGVQPQPTPH